MSMVLRKLKKIAPGPKYTPLYSTNWEEYANAVAVGGTTGWGQVAANTATMRPITSNAVATTIGRNGTARGMVLACPSSAVSNSRNNRTETMTRATMYCRGLFFFNTSGARAGISFHGGTGSSSTLMYYIQNVSGVDRLFWGTMASGTTTSIAPQTTATGMSGSAGVPVTNFVPQQSTQASVSKGYELMARATGTNVVDLFIDGIYVATMPTSFNTSGSVCGLYLANGSLAYCESFEFGSWAIA